MSKVAFFCVPAHGQVNPQLALAKALVRRGEKVTYYTAPGSEEPAEIQAGLFPAAPEDGGKAWLAGGKTIRSIVFRGRAH